MADPTPVSRRAHASVLSAQHDRGGAIVASGWLGAEGAFDHPDRRRIGRAMTASLALHAAMATALMLVVAVGPARQVLDQVVPLEFRTVLIPEAGPGGGGGGSPAPAPRKPLEVPPHQAPAVVPVATEAPPDPPPALVAPIQTNSLALLQATGNSLVSLARVGGGGRGNGLGPGRGDGAGPGTDRGSGGGAPQPGNGVSWPEKLFEVKPRYTPEAMRNKIQGTVYLEAVVLENGTVGEVRVTKPLEPGLDAAAIVAARQWRFAPARLNGKPIAVRVPLELEFRIH
jgi:protein TonB